MTVKIYTAGSGGGGGAGYVPTLMPSNRCVFPNLLAGEDYHMPKIQAPAPAITRCPNCGARYTSRIIKCDYCGCGENKVVEHPVKDKQLANYQIDKVWNKNSDGFDYYITDGVRRKQIPTPPDCRKVK
jgi:hypothetical protein